jgi:hypothetical protein
MDIYPESTILKQADLPTVGMVDLWHRLCLSELGTDMPLAVGCRKEVPAFQGFPDEINTAVLEVIGGIPSLLLLFDSLEKVEEVILTHEIGHWVLKLQGALAFRDPRAPNSNVEILLNSMCQHPALYALQRSLGHDPQYEIDDRAKGMLRRFEETKEPPQPRVVLENALLAVDDLINCSDAVCTSLSLALESNHPRTADLAAGMLEAACHHDPSVQASNPAFMHAVAAVISLSPAWELREEMSLLRDFAAGR